MPSLLADVDPQGLLEYSVVFTDRSLNHMSQAFMQVMNDISCTLKQVYHCDSVAVVPGGGTYGMEAIARQFARDKNVMVLRNGWFSYRWSQILEVGNIARSVQVLKALTTSDAPQSPFQPAPLEQVLEQIQLNQPQVVFAPHVETASGMLLPDSYIEQVAQAVHQYGGLLVIDCVASGALWLNMRALGVDVALSAPQKGWSGTPCAALVMFNQRALDVMAQTQSDSFACDLKQWHNIMQAYVNGGHAYHATLPTDGLKCFRDMMLTIKDYGFERLKQAQLQLGERVNQMLSRYGFVNVAAPGFQAPGVVVCYTDYDELHNTKAFAKLGLQTAAGVPLKCDEPEWFKTFRLGLFGLDKLQDIDTTVKHLETAVAALSADRG